MRKTAYALAGLVAFILRIVSLMAVVWLVLALFNRFLDTKIGFPRATIMPGREDSEFLVTSIVAVGGFVCSILMEKLEKICKPKQLENDEKSTVS